MQKKIIALAVAGLVSGAAFAQTNVTVYGIIDAAYSYSKAGDNKFSGIESGGLSGGRIGFRGEEDLGNGLKAVFNYEFGTTSDADSGLPATRRAFVGLSSNFGVVSLGRQYAPSGDYLGATSSNDVTSANPVNLALGTHFNTLVTGAGMRWNNSIAYNSPNWSGLDFRAIYAFGEQVGRNDATGRTHDTSDAGRYGIGARYANVPLYLTAMYQAVQDNDAANPAVVTSHGNKAWAIGGNYDFKVVKVFANYLREKYDDVRLRNNATGEIGDYKHYLWSIGLQVPVSSVGRINAEYMQHKFSDLDETKSKGLGIGYEHDLSKRTRLYTYVSRIKNDDAAAWGFSKTSGSNFLTPGSMAWGENSTNFQVGIRHLF